MKFKTTMAGYRGGLELERLKFQDYFISKKYSPEMSEIKYYIHSNDAAVQPKPGFLKNDVILPKM